MELKEKLIEKKDVFDEIARMEEKISVIKLNLIKIKEKSSEFKSRTMNRYKDIF